MQGLSLITQRLDEAEILYCIVGGLATIAYGRPRLTLDADLVLTLQPSRIKALLQAFPSKDFYLPPAEVLLAEMARETRGHFNIIHQHSALRADCYLTGKSEFSHWELSRRQRLETPFGSFWFSPPEAIIAHKLLFYREGQSEKHLEDIRSILTTDPEIDFTQLTHWIDQLGLQPEWALLATKP
jgi:hypothetical protein